jgi:8-amino-7-oxononanoate synthase
MLGGGEWIIIHRGFSIMPAWMDEELRDLRRRGLYRQRRALQSAQGPRVRRKGRECVNFGSNDYLNLAADPRLAQAAMRATLRYGTGCGSSPLMVGYLPPQRALERALAEWEQTPAALTFPSGYAANLAVIAALAGRHDALFSDQLNHASLIDGCRLSRAAVHVYRHRDVGHLDELLRKNGTIARRRVIVTDTVFSMDGDLAPLADLVELADRHNAILVIDEAHGTGVLGMRGRGLTELLPAGVGLPEGRLIKIGTFSKALGSQGGFVCGGKQLIDWLVNRSRPYVFSTALAPPVAAAARRAIHVVAAEPQRRQWLFHLILLLRDLLRDIGYPAAEGLSPIMPVAVGDPRAAVRLSRRLLERGLLVPAVRPPSVPEGTARLRISLTSGHKEEDVIQLAQALRECRGE